jgi:hypothetical protein
MNATDTRTELNITGLYFPRGGGSRSVDWSELNRDGEYEEGYTYTEAFDFEHEGETFPMIARDGYAAGIVVEGRFLDREDIEDEIDGAEIDATNDDRDPDTDPAVIAWNARRDALDAAQDDSPSQWGADGPMMNYFYPVSDYTPGDMNAWAAKLVDLPLCVVEIGDERGLALTGGGMDLSWEIAEAYVRLGYYPPTWIDLPAMSGRGESAKDRAPRPPRQPCAGNPCYGRPPGPTTPATRKRRRRPGRARSGRSAPRPAGPGSPSSSTSTRPAPRCPTARRSAATARTRRRTPPRGTSATTCPRKPDEHRRLGLTWQTA